MNTLQEMHDRRLNMENAEQMVAMFSERLSERSMWGEDATEEFSLFRHWYGVWLAHLIETARQKAQNCPAG